MSKAKKDKISPADAAATKHFEQLVATGDTHRVRELVCKYLKHKVPSWFTPALCNDLLKRATVTRNPVLITWLLKLHPPYLLPKNEKTLSALWTAVIYTHVDIVKLLINAGARVRERLGPNAGQDPECTVLHYVASMYDGYESAELIDLIILNGGDPNDEDSKGETPLHYSVFTNKLVNISKLISKGAKVNARNKNGETPLLSACKGFVREETLTLLIENGADIFARNNEGFNALHILTNSGSERTEAAELLIKLEVPLGETDYSKRYTPLQYAVAKGREKLVRTFLKYGADPNDGEGSQMLLFLAASRRSSVNVELLITHGAGIDKTTKTGRTALHIACKNLKDKNITILLEYGANINALDNDGATPFSLIEFKNLSASSQAMIKRFAKLTALNKPTNEIDLGIIKQYPKLQKFYDNCLEEIDKMKNYKVNDYSLFLLFSKPLIKLALLLRDDTFKTSPLQTKEINELFPIYGADFSRTLRKAESLYLDLNRVENRLNAVFTGYAPDAVIREIMFALLPYYVHI